MSQPSSTSTTTSTTTSSGGEGTASSTTPTEANNNNNQSQDNFNELAKDLPSALQQIKELEAKRDALLAQKDKSTKEIEKLNKRTRMETLKSLIPRELFARSDTYEAELEKVYNYKNMSDSDIAEIYQSKLRAIDLGKRVAKQHGSSLSTQDKYANFRNVPEFKSAATKINQAASDNAKLFGLMKRIAGNSNN